MLGWILLGLAATAVGVIVISGMITKNKIKEKLREKGIQEALITEIDNCENVVKLEDLESDRVLTLQGDDVDCDLEEYDTICA